jgi:glutathione-regulated potassium-efflux system protein KefB
LSFSVLLFQDLAAIPLIALVPLFAVGAAQSAAGMDFWTALKALGTIGAVVVIGHFLLDHILRLIARAKVKEAMTAAALLTVVGVAALMDWAGLSPSLGAFLAGALLSESSYRHQLEADIKPFEGLLLGLFFTAVGMSLNLELIVAYPLTVFALVALLLGIKGGVIYILARRQNLSVRASRRMAIFISQGGEFAFVLFAAGITSNVLDAAEANILIMVVTLSMVATPVLLLIDDIATRRQQEAAKAFDQLPEAEGHAIIAGFDRFGQIVGRILRGKRIPFTALDSDAAQVDLVRKFGGKAFFGDASRIEVLHAAQAGEARAFVLAIPDVEQSVRTAQLVREHFPDLPIYASARDRTHVHRLMDLGVNVIRREMFLASLDLSRELLKGLGYSEREVQNTVDIFARHDEKRLVDDYRHYTDLEKLQELARTDAETLARVFDEDAQEQGREQAGESSVRGGQLKQTA